VDFHGDLDSLANRVMQVSPQDRVPRFRTIRKRIESECATEVDKLMVARDAAGKLLPSRKGDGKA
jgi:hypothetical protein